MPSIPYVGTGAATQSEYNGVQPPTIGFGAKFNLKTFGTPNITAGGNVLTLSWPSITTTAAIVGSTSVQTVPVSSVAGMMNNVGGYSQVAVNYGLSDTEQVVLTGASAGASTITGIFLMNHASGATIIPSTFAANRDEGKYVGLGGAGSGSGPVWPTLSAGLALGLGPSTFGAPALVTNFGAQGWGYSGGYAIIAMFAQTSAIVWSVWSATNSAFTGETMVYSNTVQPMSANPNNRDVYTIPGSGAANFYRVKAAVATSGASATFWGSYTLFGNMLSSQIASVTDCNTVVLTSNATHTLAPVPSGFPGIAQSFFGTDDTAAWQEQDASIHANDFLTPSVFGHRPVMSKGASLVRAPLSNNGSLWQGSQATQIYFDPSGTYPSVTGPNGITTKPLITLGFQANAGIDGFFSKLQNLQIYANDIPGTCVVYCESCQELTGLDTVSIFGYTQIGVLHTSVFSQNWRDEHCWILPGYANYPIAPTSLTQNVNVAGAVTNATNATPIVLTLATPLTQTGAGTISVTFVSGNTAANVTNHAYVYIDSTHVSLTGVAGSGAYTSGGQFFITSAQTVSVNRNDYMAASTAYNFGEFATSYETALVTALGTNTVTAVFTKNHLSGEEILPFYQPTGHWAFGCSGKGTLHDTTIVALSGFAGGMGIGARINNSNVHVTDLHVEGCAHGVWTNGGCHLDFMSGTFNVACMCTGYPNNAYATEFEHLNVETGSNLVYDGYLNKYISTSQGFFGYAEYSLIPSGVNISVGQNDPGVGAQFATVQGFVDFMNSALHVTNTGALLRLLIFGDGLSGRPAPLQIGNQISTGQWQLAQIALGGSLFQILASNNSGASYFPTVTIDAATLGVHLAGCMFADSSVTVEGVALPPMIWGHQISTCWGQWVQTNTAGHIMKLQTTSNSGSSYDDTLIIDMVAKLITTIDITSSKFVAGTHTNLGVYYDGTSFKPAYPANAATALLGGGAAVIADGQVLVWNNTAQAFIPETATADALIMLGGSSPVNGQMPVWNSGSSKWVCTAVPTGFTAPTTTSEPIYWNGSAWAYYTPAMMGKYINGAATPFSGTKTSITSVTVLNGVISSWT